MTQRLTLALLTEAFGGRGGIAQYNRDLLTALAPPSGPAGGLVVLPRFAPDLREDPAPAEVHQLPARPGRIAYVRTALATALRLRPGIVLCGHLYMAPLAARLARLVGARLVVQLHGIEVPEPGARPALAAALERADLVLTVSRDTRRKALAFARLTPELVAVIGNTVADRYHPGARAAARTAFGLGEELTVLLSVGRLDPAERYKGQDLIIRALPQLSAARRTLVYLVAGDGADRARLEALASEQGVTDMVRFLGFLPQERLPQLYLAADLFVLPSTGEGFGIVFLEAMACGTPALGLAVGGACDALGDGKLGYAATIETLVPVLRQALAAPCPDAQALANEVRRRFGRPAFAAGISGAFARLAPPAAAPIG
ncbi:hypothetical protein ATO13_21291 [Stappia sp. 22II-S9-Z10]|nr:hypothetical protein ATO13_21291 [Stappia sp. 22II-S9-Z10]